MSVPALHEEDVDALGLPGRQLRWMVAPGALEADHCSTCVIRIAPGDRVRPAHSHPNGEEVIYIISGSGRVLVDGEVTTIRPGSALPSARRSCAGGASLPARACARRVPRSMPSTTRISTTS